MGRTGYSEFELLHRYFWNLPEKKLKLKGGIMCQKYLGALSRCSVNAGFCCYAAIVILLFLSEGLVPCLAQSHEKVVLHSLRE